MFARDSKVTFQNREWTVVRGEPDGDGDILVKGPDGLQRYAKADLCQEALSVPLPSGDILKNHRCPMYVSEAPQPISQEPAPAAQPTQPKGNDIMSSVSRTVVSVSLLDQDAGLKPELALVADLGEHVVENNNVDSLKQKLLMDPKMAVADKLAAHNEKRGKETDLDILKRTGNKVKLQPVEIHELTWSIK